MSKIGFDTDNEGYITTEVPVALEQNPPEIQGTIEVTPDIRKAIDALGKRSYPQYKISKTRMSGNDVYYIEVRPHWYNRWHTMTDMEGIPLYFLSFNDAVWWLTE